VYSQSGSGQRSKSLGVRRPVETPEADVDAAPAVYSRHVRIRAPRSSSRCLDVLGENGTGREDVALTVVQCGPDDDHVWLVG
jgi:hypothetical protein